MKNVKLMMLVAITMLFLGMGNANAQEKNPQTVIIRTFEFVMEKQKPHMIITSPDGSTKLVELGVVNHRSFEGNSGNSLIIQTEINNWKKQGFFLDGLSTTSDAVGLITTIILSKE